MTLRNLRRIELSADWPGRTGRRLAVVVSRTNDFVTGPLAEGAVAELARHGIEAIDLIEVAGAFELVAAARFALDAGAAGVVAIGAVIRGETPHFDYICSAITQGLTVLAAAGHAVTFGVLTVDSTAQAAARAGGALGNKGAEAALALVQLLAARDRIGHAP